MAHATADTRRMTKHLLICLTLFTTLLFARELPADEQLITRGQYLASIAGCKRCHSDDDGDDFAGGRAIKSKFGTFYTPNISSDPMYGIGKWNLETFDRALTQGLSPEGEHYYPSFPYTSYQNLNTYDIEALFTYLQTTTPYSKPSKEHEIGFPYSLRSMLSVWKWLYLDEGKLAPIPSDNDANNGRYLVYAVTHCDQCHSPRTKLGGVESETRLSGGEYKGEGSIAPPILSSLGGLKGWDIDDLETYLLLGEDPKGDYAGGDMADIVDHLTNYLTNEDLRQLSEFLLSN